MTQFKLSDAKENNEARWVKMDKIKYTAPDGKQRDWEMTSRTTRPANAECDGVGILAIIEDEVSGPRVILQKQFRPPVEGICIEMPAGLVDPNESLETCALRELKEETGYIGKVLSTSPIIFNDPGFCNTNMAMVIVSVDMEDERNKNPQTQLEENEFIETFTVPLKEFAESLEKLANEGYKLDARVQNVAEGIKVAKTLRLFG
ncbi:unnamed protein product [[Candida] boidinii]|uniref:Unnamed protein product n=1 Tax=Candida boidinii TaxID=5477 RepID=A0ACB5TP14_CANBO|nr:unnamed protein product [[Candida] boidinii]